MRSPQNLQEYLDRFNDNTKITGYGPAVATHLPCPWCAAPDFQRLGILSTVEDMKREATCSSCGRSGVNIFSVEEPGNKQFEFVQTGGPDAPEWLTPSPRRVQPGPRHQPYEVCDCEAPAARAGRPYHCAAARGLPDE